LPLHNYDIANMLNRVADLLDIDGENQFKVRSYRNAARTISDLSRSITEMLQAGEDLTKLPGIGKEIDKKIKEIVERGTFSKLEEMEKKIPPQILELMNISELGPKRIQKLRKELNVSCLDDLEKAAREKRVRCLEGFGIKTEEKILQEIERLKRGGGEKRFKWAAAEEITLAMINYLKELGNIDKITPAGSFRRKKETVGDLDILVTCQRSDPVMDRFVSYDEVVEVISRGDTRSSVTLRSGFQVDLRVVPDESYGAALHYFTGSQAHNIAIRKLGVQRGLKINEYGVFKDEKKIAGKTEEEIFSHVGLPYIEPELRENRGEIEAALKGKLPKLVTLEDIRGDLHVHTKASDGKFTIEEMAIAAKDRGYEYLAITEHSKRVSMAGGLDEKRLAEQIKEIERLNEKIGDFRILKSIEVDILEDGALDLSDDILKELDIVICAIHYNLNLPAEKQTERVLKALDNSLVNIFAHPSGRLIGQREPYQIDMDTVLQGAKERGCFMEVNAHPDRLDLTDTYCKRAKDIGLKVAISTDAHSTDNLENMRFGVAQARRGWLETADVLNTRPLTELMKLFRR